MLTQSFMVAKQTAKFQKFKRIISRYGQTIKNRSMSKLWYLLLIRKSQFIYCVRHNASSDQCDSLKNFKFVVSTDYFFPKQMSHCMNIQTAGTQKRPRIRPLLWKTHDPQNSKLIFGIIYNYLESIYCTFNRSKQLCRTPALNKRLAKWNWKIISPYHDKTRCTSGDPLAKTWSHVSWCITAHDITFAVQPGNTLLSRAGSNLVHRSFDHCMGKRSPLHGQKIWWVP